MRIPVDAWLKALADIDDPFVSDPDSVTTQEFSEMLGLKRAAAQRRLYALERAGKATRTRKQITAADGRRQFVTAFKLVDAKKK